MQRLGIGERRDPHDQPGLPLSCIRRRADQGVVDPRVVAAAAPPGADSFNEDQAKLQIEAKGYLDVSKLERDRRGIWRGKATLEDGRPVYVTLDLEGNIYSELSRLHIRIEPPPSNR